MKHVVILSNLDEQCGNAAYGRTLLNRLRPWHDVYMMNQNAYSVLSNKPDVVIVNWHPAVVPMSVEQVQSFKAQGSKVILILQNSFDWPADYDSGNLLCAVDAVVAHEPMTFMAHSDAVKMPNFHVIPHGIHELLNLKGYDGTTVPMIGTAGFQFPWKRTDVVVKAAKHCGVAAKIFCPPYPGYDRNREIDKWMLLYDNVHVERNWLPEETVIRCLAENVMNIFWFQSNDVQDQLGQTGSARMGLAAGRPTIISRHRKFKTLFPYEDELYIADTEEQVYQFAQEILSSPDTAKRPNKLLWDMGWSRVGYMYQDLIEEVCK